MTSVSPHWIPTTSSGSGIISRAQETSSSSTGLAIRCRVSRGRTMTTTSGCSILSVFVVSLLSAGRSRQRRRRVSQVQPSSVRADGCRSPTPPLKISLGHRMMAGSCSTAGQARSQSVLPPTSARRPTMPSLNRGGQTARGADGYVCCRVSLVDRIWRWSGPRRQAIAESLSNWKIESSTTVRKSYSVEGKLLSRRMQWARDTDPLVNINVLSPIEQTIVWQRVCGSTA